MCPLVSVIIPVYNARQYMCECLGSVLSQTIKDIEVICVDDGSTDDSLAILREYEAKDSRVRVLCQKNSGAGPARNNAIDNTTGEYIAFMDADDWYPVPDVLEALYSKAIQNNVNICGGSFSEFRDGEIKTEFQGMYSKYSFQNEGIMSFREYQFDYGFHRFIYKRDFLIDNQLYFPDYRRFQDPPFFVRAMICAKVFYAVPKVTYRFRAGHKEIQWDFEKINGLVSAIIDILELTVEHQLPVLHKIMVERLNHFTCKKPFIENATFDNLELMALLKKANALIDIDILNKTKKKRSLPSILRGGYQCYKDHGLIYTIKLAKVKLKRDRKKYMNIIIYGTEELGLLYIEKNKGFKVIAFAVNAPKGHSFSGYPVININQISNHDYDKVVIAVQGCTDDTYLELIADILKELKDAGVPFDKILTLRPYFTYRDVNLNTFEECINVRSRILRELSIILRRYKVPGAVAECGVGRGVFASVINESFPDKSLYLFDTFRGFDERDLGYESSKAIKKAKECKAMFGNNSSTGADVAVSHCPYKDKCIIKVGYVPETFKGLENEIFAFVNIDVDLYAPTLAALRFFAPRLANGGVIWVHDYYGGPWQGVKEAIDEFALKYEFTLLPVGDKLSVALIPLQLR